MKPWIKDWGCEVKMEDRRRKTKDLKPKTKSKSQMTKSVIITVYGKVQGVGFRFYTNKKAQELNIVGFVRNKPNGTVYIEAEGSENDLMTFIDWCNIGTQWARVTRIETQFVPVIGYTGFKIK